MEFVINKELPFTHKGQKVKFEIDSSYHCGYDIARDGTVRYWVREQRDIDILIADGWVIEKKPMKLWVNIYENGWNVAHNSKALADMSAGASRIACKEFQEVIE